ncbi:hypothetical protein NL676_036602 [Syzygium grande]|nr:hypothetical protein NL676_036602 [Syzygium grande]
MVGPPPSPIWTKKPPRSIPADLSPAGRSCPGVDPEGRRGTRLLQGHEPPVKRARGRLRAVDLLLNANAFRRHSATSSPSTSSRPYEEGGKHNHNKTSEPVSEKIREAWRRAHRAGVGSREFRATTPLTRHGQAESTVPPADQG